MGWSYAEGGTPDDYVCGVCGAKGVKLWRAYQSFDPDLHCAECVQKKTGKVLERKGHEIGWYVAAVPDEEGLGYWGYTSVPEAGVNWWEALPGWFPANADGMNW